MARKDYIVGNANVFEDLGHPRPAEALAKAELARKMGVLIAKRGLTQAAAAKLLQIDQPKVAALVRPGLPASPSIDSSGSSCCSAATWRSSSSRVHGQPARRGCWVPEDSVRNVYTDFGQPASPRSSRSTANMFTQQGLGCGRALKRR